ncbi:MAG: hydrogenase subunit MbhD domain-containing protein [Kiritimatiellia bacterium]|nr:hydrogenase subunit MbhD domain-containing protein [Kiritimatiellia bacterium]
MTPEALLPALMLLMTGVVVFSKTLRVALLGLSLFSMFLTIHYVYLHAPDVAMTEAALGVGLSTLAFLIVIRKTRESKDD